MTNTTATAQNLTPVATQAFLFINGAYQKGTMMIYKNGKWEQVEVNIYTRSASNFI